MATIIYLDVDDEITSAAARIRSAEEIRLALVVPTGSRLATSRMNFRLLAREAQTRGRRLGIVAADGATRALAASAGLPSFGTVGEYEQSFESRAPQSPAALAASGGAPSSDMAAKAAPPIEADAEAEARPAGADELEKTVMASGASASVAAGAPRGLPPPPIPPAALAASGGAPSSDDAARAAPSIEADTEAEAKPAGADELEGTVIVGGAAASVDAGAPRGLPPPPIPPPAAPARLDEPHARSASIPVVGRPSVWPFSRMATIIAVAIVALVLAVGGVAAYVFLPSATIVVTARSEAIGPIPLTVVADPNATSVDAAKGVVPSQRLTFDVEASGTFPATGKRVEETAATGRVTFQNLNNSSSNSIASGSIVSTEGGIQFRTNRGVTVPKADIVGLMIVPGEASVDITAVNKGTAANVPANAITVVPRDEDPFFLKVRNANPTTGGTHVEFKRVDQKDIDAAVAKLGTQLRDKFDALLADPAQVPDGLTLFPETKTLPAGTPTVDPATLVGQEIDSFDLTMTSQGAVVAVDESSVEQLAQSKMKGSVESGHRLVDGSIKVVVGDPSVDGELVTFPVTARAAQVRLLDAKTLLPLIKGKPIPQARSILEQYGRVDLSVWPDWVTAIPTLDGRISLRVATAAGSGPGASPSGPAAPAGSPSASAAP